MKNAFCSFSLALAVVCLSVRSEDDEDCKEAHEQRGFCLLNNKYKELQANSLRQCYMNCAREKSSCHSINFFSAAAKRCEMNTATRETRPEDFTSCEDSTYMENVLRVKKGSTNWAPGRSCKDIRQSEDSVGDGEFWIDPDASGNPIKVYCDMTTDEGGWTLIRRVLLTDGSIPSKDQQISVYDYREQLMNYDSNDHVFVMTGFLSLRTNMGFEQMRFYCHKKIPGTVFHVATNKNPLGEAVLQYFTGNTTTPPQACGSFSTFPDDNSTLSRKCAEWGRTSYNNIWGLNSTYPTHMSKRLCVWYPIGGNARMVAMCGNDYFCEDKIRQGSPGDEWKVYVR